MSSTTADEMLVIVLPFFIPRGRDFKESVVGLAYKGAICYGRYSVGIVQDTRVSVRAVGGTATHEMGHILNMSHDSVEGSRSSLVLVM